MQRGQKIQVGIYGEDASEPHDDSPKTVGEIMSFHEFGGKGGRPPERPWLRGYVDTNQARIKEMVKRTAGAVLNGMPQEQALNLLGMKLVAEIKQGITAGIPPALAESTKAAKKRKGGKAKDTALIMTGQSIGSINHRIVA